MSKATEVEGLEGVTIPGVIASLEAQIKASNAGTLRSDRTLIKRSIATIMCSQPTTSLLTFQI
jgi:hypothetical protein